MSTKELRRLHSRPPHLSVDESSTHSPNSANTRLSRFLGSGRLTGKPETSISIFNVKDVSAHRLPVSLPLPIRAIGSRQFWRPVYTRSGGQPRRTSSDPARPWNTPEPPTHAAAPPHRSLHSHGSALLYHGAPAAPPGSHPACYRCRRRCALLGSLCPGSQRTCTS